MWVKYGAGLVILPCPPLLCQYAATSRGNRAPIPPWAICAYRDRSAYTYTPSGRVPAQIASSWLRFARLTAPVVAAYGNSGGVVSGARAHRSAPVEPETAPGQSIANSRRSVLSRLFAAARRYVPLRA